MMTDDYITICPPSKYESNDTLPVRRNHVITVKLTETEWQEITAAAAAAGNLPRAAYMRSEALKAARRIAT